MPFSRLLKKVISDSGKTQKEIIEECRERGRSIDKAYLSKLLNGKVPAPAEELARLLANICNYDERKMVLECYIDKAPKEIFEALAGMKEVVHLSTISMFSGIAPSEIIEEVKETIKNEPISDFVMDILDKKEMIIRSCENDYEIDMEDDDVTFTLKEPPTITVKDSAMEPLIAEGAKVTFVLQEKYDVNDILLIKLKEVEVPIIRYGIKQGKNIMLIPLNKKYQAEQYKTSDVIILGRVNKIITEI